MRTAFFLILFVLLSACRHNVSVAEQGAAPDSVPDLYPLYPGCETYYSPEMQRWCFKRKFSAALEQALAKAEWRDSLLLSVRGDTLWLDLQVDSTGYVRLRRMQGIDSVSGTFFISRFNRLLKELPPLSPAVKRGVPVSVRFRVPVVKSK